MTWVAALEAHTIMKPPCRTPGSCACTPLVQQEVSFTFLISNQAPWVACLEGISNRTHGLWDSFSRGVESALGGVCGMAQQVAACWTGGHSGDTVWDLAEPQGHNNPLPEQPFFFKVLSLGGC
eukprot:433612-Pelagomonas_calceolata.AAC.2